MVVSLSLQYSAVYNIVLVIMALWLWLMRKDKLSEYKILLFFLISGMVTSYIDFLTYPIAVVGILSVLSVHTLGVEWRNILFTFKNIVYWGIGYIGMWVGKWLMGSIILRKNLFEDAVEQFLLRASSGNASNNRLDGIRDNLGIYSNKIFVCLFAVLIIYSIIVLWRMKIKVKREQWLEIGSYGIIMLMPFVWMFLAANHSQEHAWFVHRGLSVSVLALGSIFICLKEKSSTS